MEGRGRILLFTMGRGWRSGVVVRQCWSAIDPCNSCWSWFTGMLHMRVS